MRCETSLSFILIICFTPWWWRSGWKYQSQRSKSFGGFTGKNFRRSGHVNPQLQIDTFHLPFTGTVQKSGMMVQRFVVFFFPSQRCGDRDQQGVVGGACSRWKSTNCLGMQPLTRSTVDWHGHATCFFMGMIPIDRVKPSAMAGCLHALKSKETGSGWNNLCTSNLLGKHWRKFAFCVTLLAEATTDRDSTTVATSAQIGETTMWLVLWPTKWVMPLHVSWMRSHVCTTFKCCVFQPYLIQIDGRLHFMYFESMSLSSCEVLWCYCMDFIHLSCSHAACMPLIWASCMTATDPAWNPDLINWQLIGSNCEIALFAAAYHLNRKIERFWFLLI